MNLAIIIFFVIFVVLLFTWSVLILSGGFDDEEDKHTMTVEDITDKPRELTEYQEECLRQSVNAFMKG